jgi:RimJ/RimL family protein N-acetyltransferase
MKEKSNLILKDFTPRMVSKEYVNWMNNYEITKYTEQKYTKHTMASIKKFVAEKKKSKNEFLYGIFYKKNNNYIHYGTIKIGPINLIHKYAYISYVIGNKKNMNLGIATKSIKQILIIAKKKFKLKKILAGCYSNNIPSYKVLVKNNFKKEGRFTKMYKFEKKRIDRLVYSKLI